MILIDYKAGNTKPGEIGVPREMVGYIKANGVESDLSDLQFGDAAFEGYGPDGTMAIGVERKSLHDMLSCIDDARYAGHQRVGMKQMYRVSVLMIEGHWKPHDPSGVLMEGFNGGTSWGYCRYRSQRTLYSKLKRYLISAALAGVIIDYSRNVWHTSYNICEWYHYFQKPWNQHTSHIEIQKVAIPSLLGKPALVRKWANDLEDIGTKLSLDAERLFKKPITLANADELDWLRIPGVGVKTARKIVREIWGTNR